MAEPDFALGGCFPNFEDPPLYPSSLSACSRPTRSPPCECWDSPTHPRTAPPRIGPAFFRDRSVPPSQRGGLSSPVRLAPEKSSSRERSIGDPNDRRVPSSASTAPRFRRR